MAQFKRQRCSRLEVLVLHGAELLSFMYLRVLVVLIVDEHFTKVLQGLHPAVYQSKPSLTCTKRKDTQLLIILETLCISIPGGHLPAPDP